MLTVLLVFAGFFSGVTAYLIGRALARRLKAAPNWLLSLTGDVPWATPRSVKAYGDSHGIHNIWLVSRHDLAECGLTCPCCGALVAEQGDRSLVRRMLVNGRENEVLKCLNSIENEDGSKRVCGAILVASPDTEHGDDQIDGDPDAFYRFVKTTADRVLRDRYGVDATSVDADGVVTVGKRPPAPGLPIDAATGKPVASWPPPTGRLADPNAPTDLLPAIKDK
jgi:hypothetical protein